MSDFLETMAQASAERVVEARKTFKSPDLDLPVVPLRLHDFDIIAEIKDASPSSGPIAPAGSDRRARAREYAKGGAAAISVLTEPSKFAGDLSHLREVVKAVDGLDVPVMRKDFLVDPLQILEARAAGASGVLLIAALLPESKLRTMLACAYEYSMFVLLEAFDDEDLRRCAKLLLSGRHTAQAEMRQLLIGVNTRNLRTLEVDPRRLASLASVLPRNVACVAESGLNNAGDAAAVSRLGYELALVGTALMRSDEPAKLISQMRDSGRRETGR